MLLESRYAADHPLRRIKALADVALKELSPLFDEMNGETGRPSVPPERLLEATLSMALSTGGLRRSRVRGLQRTQLAAHLVAAAYNPIRIAKLTTAAA